MSVLPAAAGSGAARSPVRADRDLVRMAVRAELTYLLIVLVPLVPLVALQAFFLGPVYASCLGAVLVVTMWWGVQAVASEPEGQIPAPGAPLRQWVDEICVALNAPRIDKIVLTDDLNAGAYQTMGFLSMAGTRRTLEIGIPLLRLMTASEVRSVIAHEIGHFSREHGRLGHWVYLVRSKWDHYLSDWSGTGFVDGLLKGAAARFIPVFLERSSDWSIQCEFEADALAATATDKQGLAGGLCRFELASHWLEHHCEPYLDSRRRRESDAPSDFWDCVCVALANCGPGTFDAAVEAARARKRATHDTHPPLQDRLSALGVAPAQPAWDDAPCAGATLLGTQWESLLGRVNAAWKERAAQGWRFEHVRRQWLATRVAAPPDAVSGVVYSEHLERDDASLQRLRDAAGAHPENARLRYELGMALLHRKSPEGVDLVREGMKADRRLAVRGHNAILRFLADSNASAEELVLAGKRLAAAVDRRQAALAGLWRQIAVDGQFWALPADAAALLAEAFRPDAFLDGCWALQTERRVGDMAWPVIVLVPRIEYQQLAATGLDEDRLRQRYVRLVEAISAPEQSVLVHSVMTAEPLHPRLLEKLQRVPGSCLVAARSVINEGVHRVDSL